MKTIMKDYSKRKEFRYAVQDSNGGGAFGRAIAFYPSLKSALLANPDAKPARGVTKPDGTFRVLR